MLSQNTNTWEELFLRWKLQITAILAGLVLLIGGFVLTRVNINPTKVEIIDPSVASSQAQGEIVVEVSGEVKSPGVYHLPMGSRVDDAITAAGGLTDGANLDYLAKSINRASKLSDGQKIYIKHSEALSANISSTGSTPSGEDPNSKNLISNTININSASQKELESLWGIGPVTAQSIIEQRPYSDIGELLSKKIVKSNVYERIKNQISVY